MPCDEDDEGEPLTPVVVLETQGLELIPVLHQVEIALDAPSLLVEAEYLLCCVVGKGGLEDEHPEGGLQRLKPLGRVLPGCPDPFPECLLFLCRPVHVLVQDDPGPVFPRSFRLPVEDGVHLLIGAVDEAPLVVEVVFDCLVFKEVLREWDDVLVAVAGEQRQVLERMEAPVCDDQLPLECKGTHQVLHAGLVDHASRIHPREHRLVGVEVVSHEDIDLHLPCRPVLVAVLGEVVLM